MYINFHVKPHVTLIILIGFQLSTIPVKLPSRSTEQNEIALETVRTACGRSDFDLHVAAATSKEHEPHVMQLSRRT